MSDAITKQEIEVAILVLRGFNNQDIADQLSIGKKIVQYHTSNIYKKCGYAKLNRSSRSRFIFDFLSHKLTSQNALKIRAAFEELPKGKNQ